MDGTALHTRAAEADDDRLALAEVNCRLAQLISELSAMRDGSAFPAMAPDRRIDCVRELDVELARMQVRQAELVAAVPDPDAVVAADGSTPPQRRAEHREAYLRQRQLRRTALQDKHAYLTSVLKDKEAPAQVRRKARDAAQSVEGDRTVLDAEPADDDLRSDDMCPDAVHLSARHGYVHTAAEPAWPCPAWPGQQSIWRQVSRTLNGIAANRQPHELTRWELTLHCGHVVQRVAHRSYTTYAAAGGMERACETCGVDPSFVVAERSLGAAGSAPATQAPAPPAPPTPAQRARLTKRAERLEAQAVELRRRLQDGNQ